ncbi:hypothetical protein LT493_44405 [Streptomyces tricolor]|nr:hypothetical protein [Streptomyces tricolor]
MPRDHAPAPDGRRPVHPSASSGSPSIQEGRRQGRFRGQGLRLWLAGHDQGRPGRGPRRGPLQRRPGPPLERHPARVPARLRRRPSRRRRRTLTLGAASSSTTCRPPG